MQDRWVEVTGALESARDNILAVISQATAEEWNEGLEWYAQAQKWILNLSDRTGLAQDTVAEVFAALSPANKIDRNLQDTRALCRAALTDDPQAFDRISCGTYNRNKDVAISILTGDGELSGQKVTAFAENLKGNWEVVTIDRHAFNVALGKIVIINKRGPKITPKRYELTAEAYRQVAGELGIAPAQAQAVAWVVWKRIIGR